MQPADKEGGLVLSSENGWTIRETVSPLWNLLWSWLIDDKGENVLRDKDDVERFPDFDVVPPLAFVKEPVNLVDRGTLVVAAK